MSWVTPWRLPPVSVTAGGVPWPSVVTWCLEPGRARPTGLGPVLGRPDGPGGGSRRSPPWTSRASRPGAVRSAAPGAGRPRPRPRVSPTAAASTSCPTRSPTPLAANPIGCQCAARTGCPEDTADRPAPACPDHPPAAHPPAATARSAPTGHPPPATAAPKSSPRPLNELRPQRTCPKSSFVLAPVSVDRRGFASRGPKAAQPNRPPLCGQVLRREPVIHALIRNR